MSACASDRDDAVLERLAEGLEDGTWKLRQLVEEEHAAVPQRAGMFLDYDGALRDHRQAADVPW